MRYPGCILGWFGHLVFILAAVDAGGATPEGLLAALQDQGIRFGKTVVLLSEPATDPNQAADEIAASQRGLAGRRPWDQFVRDSVVAPVQIDLDYLKDAQGDRLGQKAHFAFVVHAAVSTLRDSEAMEQMFATEVGETESEGFQSRPLGDAELQELGIEKGEGESYGWLQVTLLNKIEVSGVIRSQRQDGEDFIVIAWKLDERFSESSASGEKLQNQWRELKRDDTGNVVRGEGRSYSGAAGYLLVTAIEGVPNASMVEGLVLLHEPEDWFGGSNLLRSKLPLMIQESARKLRRGLK